MPVFNRGCLLSADRSRSCGVGAARESVARRMAELKTKKTNASVTRFLEGVENEQRRNNGIELLRIFKELMKMQPRI